MSWAELAQSHELWLKALQALCVACPHRFAMVCDKRFPSSVCQMRWVKRIPNSICLRKIRTWIRMQCCTCWCGNRSATACWADRIAMWPSICTSASWMGSRYLQNMQVGGCNRSWSRSAQTSPSVVRLHGWGGHWVVWGIPSDIEFYGTRLQLDPFSN